MRDFLGTSTSAAQDLLRAIVASRLPAAVQQPVPMARAPMGGGMAPPMMAGGGMIRGPGTGRSDDVPAMLDGQSGELAVSNGEYVIPADVVAAMGDGASDAGGKQLDSMVENVRSGYAKKLEGMAGPVKGGKAKFLGGLFDAPEQQTESEASYNRQDQGLISERNRVINGRIRGRDPSGDLAGENADIAGSRDRLRGLVNDGTGFQSALQRGQDLIGSSFDPNDPYGDTLISASLGDFDRGTQISEAAADRSAAGRGAFGDRQFVAQDERANETNRNRALLAAGLREQGISRRTAAAQSIADLAGREREGAFGDIAAQRGLGADIQGRRQAEIDTPYTRAERLQGLVRGGQSQTTTQSGGGPSLFGQLSGLLIAGAGAAGAGAGAKDGGLMTKPGKHAKRKMARGGMCAPRKAYADGGEVIPPEPWMPPKFASPMAAFGAALDRAEPLTGQDFPVDPKLLLGFTPSGMADAAEPAAADMPMAPAMADAPAQMPPSKPMGMAATVPVPVSKPAGMAPDVAMAPAARRKMVTAAQLPPMLQSPEPTGMAPPAQMSLKDRVMEAIAPPAAAAEIAPEVAPAAAALTEAKPDWAERWATNPFTRIGLAMMASNNPTFLGALGEGGLAAAKGIAFDRQQKRQDDQLRLQGQKESRQERRDVAREAREEKKARIDLIDVLQKIENGNRDDLRADKKLELEQQAAQSLVNYRNVRANQFERRLGIAGAAEARLAKGKTATGKAAAMDPAVRARLTALGKAQAEAEASGGTEEAARLSKIIASASGGAAGMAAPPPLPDGFLMDDGEE